MIFSWIVYLYFARVIIGAPKAESTHVNYTGIQEPGVLWKCSLGLDNDTKCTVLHVDGLGMVQIQDWYGFPYALKTWHTIWHIGEVDLTVRDVSIDVVLRDKKDGGMLGGAMFLGKSGRFVACSSRWTNQKYKLHPMNGLCHWMRKEELIKDNYTVPGFSHRLAPLLNRSKRKLQLNL